MDKRAFETRLNVLVAYLLSKALGLKAISEYISSRRRADVAIFINGVKLILEGSYSKSDVEQDVKEKIEKGLADLGVAIHYKGEYPQDLTDSELENRLRNSRFYIRLVIPEDISETLITYLENRKITSTWITGWMDASITDLASILGESIQFILRESDIERCINEVESTINDFVERLDGVDRDKNIARRLYEILYKLYGLSVGNYREIDELIYAQAALALLLSTTFYQTIRVKAGLEDISTYIQWYGERLGIKRAFENALRINWTPIYSVALEIVDVLPDILQQGFRRIAETATRISSMRALLRRDFSGKVYHKIIGDWSIRKGFATYFTSIPAAYLLAYLTVFTRTGIFREGYRRVKVGDLTCGSGTLLTAIYTALRDLYLKSAFAMDEDVNFEEFHKNMLEEDLWGMDALKYAVQIASINLAFQDPTISVNKMNMYSVPLGKENEKVILGSLEFFFGNSIPSVFFTSEEYYPFIEGVRVATVTGVGEVPNKIPSFDVIIMNPPFTRATGRGGKERGGLFGFIVDKKVRASVINRYNVFRECSKNELNAILTKYIPKAELESLGIAKQVSGIGQAGEGLLFLHLASKRIKNEGKIAFVLPKSLLTGLSWLPVRSLLLDKFHTEHIVISYDSQKGYNFSESTNLSEVLIVARKKDDNEVIDESEKTKITILLSKPISSLEARALAFNILGMRDEGYLEVNGSRAYVYSVTRKSLKDMLINWGILMAFPSPKLTKMVNEILSGHLFGTKIPVTSLGRIAEVVGLAVRRGTFHKTFRRITRMVPEALPALIGGGESIRFQMLVRPNAWVICSDRKKFTETSSRFLVPDRVWVDTMHATALVSDEPVVASMFFGIRPKPDIRVSESELIALILWLNTTWGILTLLANRSETRGRWIEFTISRWKFQPVLDVSKLSKDEVENLVKVFNDNCERKLRRLPDQFNPTDIDQVRLSIDKGFLEALGIETRDEEIKELYKSIHENLNLWIKGIES